MVARFRAFLGLKSRVVTSAAMAVGRLRPHRRAPGSARAVGVDGNKVKPGGFHDVSGARDGAGGVRWQRRKRPSAVRRPTQVSRALPQAGQPLAGLGAAAGAVVAGAAGARG